MTSTPTLDRAKAHNYGPRDGNNCCLHCKYSRTAEYDDGGTKFVCDELNMQVLKPYGCDLFKRKKYESTIQSVQPIELTGAKLFDNLNDSFEAVLTDAGSIMLIHHAKMEYNAIVLDTDGISALDRLISEVYRRRMNA